jgi:hypothetical protein
MTTDDMPTMTCPQCKTEYTDYDGFGVLACAACGYCTHASRDGEICTLCGDRRGSVVGAGTAPAPLQIERLGRFLLTEIGTELLGKDAVVDAAIRLLRAAYVGRVTITRLELTGPPFLPERTAPRLIGDLRRFIQWYGPFGVLDGLRFAFNGAPSPEAPDSIVGEHMAVREILRQLAPLWTEEGGDEG